MFGKRSVQRSVRQAALLLSSLGICVSTVGAESPRFQRIVKTTRSEYFVVTGSIRREKELVTVDVLVNENDARPIPGSGGLYRSTIDTHAFDCNARRSTIIRFEIYEGLDGGGKRLAAGVNEDADSMWRKVEAATTAEMLRKYVCDRAPAGNS